MIARAGKDTPGSPGCLPNAQQTLLLQAACGAGELARQAWQRWREQHDIASPDAVTARLLPWIYLRREELGLPLSDVALLEGTYRYAWLMNQRLMNSAAMVVRSLRAEGINVILLKGLPLIIEAYRDAGGRYMEDFDVMIQEEQVEQAVAVLDAEGWKPLSMEDFSARTRRWRHSSELVHESGRACDVHWRLMRRPNEPVSEAPVWEAKRSIRVRDEQTFAPSVEHMLVHLFVHGMSWQRVPPIRWILDTHLLLRCHTLDWHMVLADASRRGVTLPVAEALETYNRILPGIIPEDVRREAARLRPSWRQRLAYEQVARPYEEASWRVVWATYLTDWRQAQVLERVQPGGRGFLRHLLRYWRVGSPFSLPWQFAKRLARKVLRTVGRRP